ncbi:uncharacterized protein N7487_000331 [Penicillium crustosum]|uniref:uncharacterized protein n=1 Tax=Penicillium crustosum TaxID=36656 RepID=UPI00239D3297|nr:uncharacterized protein N7487_000331 [Penicillium crustosum]KAJ5416781.1 hypothetical protein N7487_000331 [Penicillium crustosum]
MPRKRRAQRLVMSDAPKDGNIMAAWASIVIDMAVCSDGPMPMHAPSELFLGGGEKGARLHVPLFLVSPQLHP